MRRVILVVGATGALGSEVCRRLRARNLAVRGLVRPGSIHAAILHGTGVEISAGDLRSREAVTAACRGVSTVISTATVMGSKDKSLTLRAVDRDAQLQLVEIARASGAGVASGMSLGAQSTRGDVVDSPLQRELGLPLMSVRDYAARAVSVGRS